MSLSLIAVQPAIDEPSNIRPSSSASSSMTPAHIVRCCHLPLGSVKRRSTHSMSLSLIRATISFGLVAMVLHFLLAMKSRAARGVELGCLERVLVALDGEIGRASCRERVCPYV